MNIKRSGMKEQFRISNTFRMVTLFLTFIGAGTFIIGLRTDPALTWGSYLVAAYYFLSLSIGAAFFMAIQYITHSGWSSAFRRIPEAMTGWIPFAAVFFLLLFFGMHDLYHWTHDEAVAEDNLLVHKSPYLNETFFFIRMIISFTLWIVFTMLLRRFSLEEDRFDPSDTGGILAIFHKSELYSRILIFILALTFSATTFDWIMSVEPHWYSSIFAFKNFIAAFLHGVSIIALIVFILHARGFFTFLNEYHLHDFSRYIFILSVIWGYLWFAQFMIIWYGNIPEETAYYYDRWQQGWKLLFWLQIALNWGVPFLVLLPVKTNKNIKIIISVICILIIGQYIDIFVQVIPPVTGAVRFGWIEVGIFTGFAGLFSLIVATALGKAAIVPRNHPYLEESLNHQFE